MAGRALQEARWRVRRRAIPGVRRRRERQPRRQVGRRGGWRLVRTIGEAGALVTVALVGVVTLLGRLSQRLEGSGLWSHLLPFAGVVLVVGGLMVLALRGWLLVRRWLAGRLALLPSLIAIAACIAALRFAGGPVFQREVANLRGLIGGAEEAEREAIAHQVYAAYRRADLKDMQRILERGRVYETAVREAAAAFDVDAEMLMGVGAAESSFYPRDSADGGRGLFQITAVPTGALAAARRRLGTAELDALNQRHNAFIAAATLRRYLDEMKGDPFLGLLAYNIGPRNGGLRSIMTQYGARDFVTIQPYLQKLPRDYPIRVLSAALAYRLWRTEGGLPRYEEGDNARRIQQVGIPGLAAGPAIPKERPSGTTVSGRGR